MRGGIDAILRNDRAIGCGVREGGGAECWDWGDGADIILREDWAFEWLVGEGCGHGRVLRVRSRPIENGSKSLPSAEIMFSTVPKTDGVAPFMIAQPGLSVLETSSRLLLLLLAVRLCRALERRQPSPAVNTSFLLLLRNLEVILLPVIAVLSLAIPAIQSGSRSKESLLPNGSISSKQRPKQSALGSPSPSSPKTPSSCWPLPHAMLQSKSKRYVRWLFEGELMVNSSIQKLYL